MEIKKLILLITFVGLFLAGCGSISAESPPTPTVPPTETATQLPTETATLEPTKTPRPSSTPIPPTPTVPAPEILNNFLVNAQIVYVDSFDKNVNWGLDAGKITEGHLEVVGKNWNGLTKRGTLHENQGILIDFTYTSKSVFEVYFGHGDWMTDSYRRFGVYVFRAPAANLWLGKDGLGFNSLIGNFTTNPDVEYTLLMTIGEDGDFLAVIWDPANPEKQIYYHEKLNEEWYNLKWNFSIGADAGTIIFDNFRIVEFDSYQ